jgi:biotin transport system substrate-specific component
MAQVLVDRVNPRTTGFLQTYAFNAAAIVGASLLMAVCAHVSIPLWFTPVPITLQTFGVMLLALTMGGWRASAALVLYLLEGISGLPVFSPHGPGGIAQVLGPTGGFLMSYPLAALIGGLLAEKFVRTSRIAAFAIGAITCEAIIFAAGSLWLLSLSHMSPSAIFMAAVLPFIPGEILKGVAAIASALGVRQISK